MWGWRWSDEEEEEENKTMEKHEALLLYHMRNSGVLFAGNKRKDG